MWSSNVTLQLQEFIDTVWEEYNVAMARQPCFVSVTLLKEYEKDSIYRIVIRFQSLENAAAWRGSKDHKEPSPRLKSLYTKNGVQVYDVVALQ